MIRKVSTLFRETEHPGKNLSDFIFQRNTNDQNNSYEVTINGFQVRKINEIIFGLRYGKPSSALRPKLGCSPSTQRFLFRLFF